MALILAIESSCDETAVAVIKDGELLSNIVSTQIDVHRKYGGVMPEIASRLHAENISIVLKEAVETFLAMRSVEGERLLKDVTSRTENILSKVEFVEARSPETVTAYKEKITQKIKEMLSDNTVDEQRVLTEVAIFADKVAVAEETVRLRSHIKQFNSLLLSDEAVGRKLDFIVQEMNREANTIGSKAQDIEIAHTVVDIKSEIEKIREQIQNME